MSISPINIPSIDGKNHLHHLLNNQSDTGETSFKVILDKTTQHKVNGYLSNESVPKDQLIEIINNIKVQMDAKLIQALSMETRSEIDAPTSMSMIDLLEVPQTTSKNSPSKLWHTTLDYDITEEDTHFDRIITQAAKTHSVDEALVKSVIKVESNFNPNITSPKGAMGLMQLMPETARELGVQNPYNPVENVEAGTRYLKMLLNRFNGNVPLSLSAYNWGMGNMERRPEHMPTETKQYVDKVTSYYEKMKG
jgi:soluble lytic murein transglycosylase-like protein